MAENKTKPAMRGPGGRGPGRGMRPVEKAKDFKGSIRRLFSELKAFKIVIVIFLAIFLFFLY